VGLILRGAGYGNTNFAPGIFSTVLKLPIDRLSGTAQSLVLAARSSGSAVRCDFASSEKS
jgi:hypothetical protein